MLDFFPFLLIPEGLQVEQTLQVPESVINLVFGTPGDQFTLASRDNALVVDRDLAGQVLAGRLFALVFA
jgi:hypothetical protein